MYGLLLKITLTVCLLWQCVARCAEYPEIVIDGNSGLILQEQRADQIWYPASLTKMMTLYLTFQALESGALILEEQLPVSANAGSQPASRLGLSKGQTITVKQAILAVATISANDVAVVLAERLAVDEKEFAKKMTDQALGLGMTSTVFQNATGLPNSRQFTTARDMALLGYRLLHDFPKHFEIFSTHDFVFNGRSKMNTNGLLTSYPGIDGIKTGFTCASGYNLVASVHREDRRLIGVVLGTASSSRRNDRMKRLLDLGFSQLNQGEKGSFIDVPTVSAKAESVPPVRLNASECGQNRIITQGKLPGWGILLGIYKSKKQARTSGIRLRAELKKIINRGQVAILKRKFQLGASWKLLVVGLKRSHAGQACRYMRSNGRQCIAVSPERMNSRGFNRR